MRQNESRSPNELEQVQQIRTRFASALRTDDEVSIEQVISSAPEQLRELLVGELVSAELDWHRELGTTPPLDSYFERFPAESDIITRVYRQTLGEFDQLPSFDSLEATYDETRVVSNPTHDDDEISRTYSPRDTKADSVRESKSKQKSKPKSKSHSSSLFVPDNREDRKYFIEHEIDRGGMGAILQVKDLQLNRTLAMKVILGQEDGSQGSFDERAAEKIERFFREASITSRLDHPGVVPVHELGKDEDGRSYFTMKLVQGKTLKHVFKELKNKGGPWNRARVIEVLIRVCDTIAFAHSKGVIHRDLKPANIMVGEFGETYVMDWGLAKTLREQEKSPSSIATSFKPEMPVDSSHTMVGSIMGTPQYMPPEQASGRIDDLDERSDIYSLGALLYQMLSGHKPFHQHKTGMDVVRAVSKEPPIAILQHTKKAPAELVAIANKAMKREQEERYTNATEMADDLRAFLDNRVVAAYRTGWAAKVEKFVVRNRSIIATAMLLLVAGLGTVAIQQYWNSIEVTEKNTQLSEKSVALVQKSEALTSSLGVAEKARNVAEAAREEAEQSRLKEKRASDRLIGRKLVFDANNIIQNNGDPTLASLLAIEALDQYKYDSPDTRSAIYAGAAKLSESLILRGHRGSVRQAVFSFDQKRIVTISSDGTGIVWDANTGEKVSLIINKRGAGFNRAVFSKDGTRILASGANGTIGIWETETGVRKLSFEIGQEFSPTDVQRNVWQVEFLADEKQIVAIANDRVFLLDGANGKFIGTLPTNLESKISRFTKLRASSNGTRIIAGTDNGDVFVWDAKTQALIQHNPGLSPTNVVLPVNSIEFNFDGSLFVTTTALEAGQASGPARIWHTETGKLHSKVSLGNGISTSTFHPKRNQLIVAVDDGSHPTIQIWDLNAKQVIATSQKLPAVVWFLKFARERDAFVTISGDTKLSFWELESNQSDETRIRFVDDLVGHDQGKKITFAALAENGLQILSASEDQTARLWRIDAKRAVPMLGRTTFGNYATIRVRFNSKGDRILLPTANNRSGNLWSYPELELIGRLDLNDELSGWSFDGDGDLIFAGTKSGTVFCWNASDGSFVREFKDIGTLYSATYDSSTHRVFFRTSEKTSIWNLADGRLEQEFAKEEDGKQIVSPDGSVVLSFSTSDRKLKQIDPATGSVKELSIDTIQPVEFSPDGRLFWCRGPSVGTDPNQSASIQILNGKTLKVNYSIEDNTSAPRWVKWAAFSPDSSRIRVEHYWMGGDDDGPSFSIWSTKDGTKISEFGENRFHVDQIIGANADFSRFLMVTKQGTQLIDGTSGQPILTLSQTIGKFQYAYFSQDGRFIFTQELSDFPNPETGRPDSRVTIRGGNSGRLLADLPSEKNRFFAGVLPDSRYFLTFSDFNQVQAWPIEIVGQVKRHLSRAFSYDERKQFLAQPEVDASIGLRSSKLTSIENRIRLLGSITADRRQEAWKALDELETWLGPNPTPEDLDTAIALSQPMISGPFDNDPEVLVKIANFHRRRGNGTTVVRLLEQASRHPRANFDLDQLESARQAISPVVGSFQSADALAQQLAGSSAVPTTFAAATAWAKQNDTLLYRYLTAQQHVYKKEFGPATKLLDAIVETLPTEPAPYVLYANCLLEQSKPDIAADVLRLALDIEMCRSPEVWKTWLQISFSELGRSPKQMLDKLPPPTARARTETSFDEHVRWLLQCLIDGRPLRINSGCYADMRIGEDDWSKDCFYTFGFGFFEFNGEVSSFILPIENTDNEILYQSERYFPDRNEFPAGYQLPLPNGNYEITLGFSEIYAVDRSFDVIVESKTILKDYDPAQGEFATAENVTTKLAVSDGMLNIEFVSNNNTPPKISNISIVAASK